MTVIRKLNLITQRARDLSDLSTELVRAANDLAASCEFAVLAGCEVLIDEECIQADAMAMKNKAGALLIAMGHLYAELTVKEEAQGAGSIRK